jgi:NitT/TauT family transport system substrate-binding protein
MLLSCLLLTGTVGVAATVAQDEPTKVRALLPAPRVLGLYPQLIPEVLGYYEDEGIDVTWEPTDGSSFVVQQVAAGNADVGVAQTGPVLLGFEQSPNFTSIYDTLSNTRGHLNDLWVASASGVTSLGELPAMAKIGVKDLAGGELPALRQALAKAGLTEEEDYTLVPLGESAATQAQALADGTVDAVYIVVFSLIPMRNALEEAGHTITCLTCDASEPLTSQVVIANDDFLAEHRDAVVALCRGMAKATWFGQVDPEAAAAAMRIINPEEQADPQEVADKLAQAAISFEPEPLPADRDHYGMQSMDGWQNAMDLIIDPSSPSGLRGPVDLGDLVDNSLIDGCNDFDRQEVAGEAEAYEP